MWLWYSFIATASYGGELRAFLLKPKLNSPIDTIMDIVDSGFPWRVVDYGDGMWNNIASLSEFKGIQKFIRDKIEVEYKDFPLEYVSMYIQYALSCHCNKLYQNNSSSKMSKKMGVSM